MARLLRNPANCCRRVELLLVFPSRHAPARTPTQTSACLDYIDIDMCRFGSYNCVPSCFTLFGGSPRMSSASVDPVKREKVLTEDKDTQHLLTLSERGYTRRKRP